MTDRVILHVDADAFFASVEQITNPLLKGKPVVVCGLPLEHGVVTAASYEARPYGVKAGMPVAQARKLLPDGYFVPVNIPKYLFFSTRLLSIYLQMTPRVEAYSVDEVFLDLSGVADPWKQAVELKRQIAQETGLTVSIGIGPNKLIAKIASDLDKPDGLTMVLPEEVLRVLGPLPVERCPGIGPKTAANLKALGIVTFSDLAQVPLAKLRWWFGKNGEKLYWAARGVDETPMVLLDQLPPLKSKGHEITFDQPMRSVEAAQAVIWEISGRLGFEFRSQQRLAGGIRLKVKPVGGKAVTRQTRLLAATADERVIAKTAFQLFRQGNFTELRGLGIYGIYLVSSVKDQNQLHLFPEDIPGEERLQTAIDHLKQKYGEGIVVPALNLLSSDFKGSGKG
ncbi:MAG TPA: DNA polymerase IV [Bacillota bacterium]|nr:DNA polymerase IV [Bacillota bacterium]